MVKKSCNFYQNLLFINLLMAYIMKIYKQIRILFLMTETSCCDSLWRETASVKKICDIFCRS